MKALAIAIYSCFALAVWIGGAIYIGTVFGPSDGMAYGFLMPWPIGFVSFIVLSVILDS